MTTFIKIAWRNILRNKHRSAITILAVAIGLSSLIFLKGFVDGADHQMVENYTDLLIGHIQIHKEGFQKNAGVEKSINNAQPIAEALRKTGSFLIFSQRIKEFVLMSSPESSSGVLLMGVDPVDEKKVSVIHKRITKGNFLKKGGDNEIIIGKTLSENLKTDIGDKVVIMGQASDGSIAASAFNVCGIVETGSEEIDKNLALITLKAAQELFVMGSKISEIVVKTDAIDKIDAVAEKLKTKINTRNFEVLTWKDISPVTYQWIQFDQVFTNLILFIVLIVVAAGILNTILMSVLERTHEFGIMLALGTKPNQLVFLVMCESFLLGLFGILLGTFTGASLVFFFGVNGINLSVISHALNNFYIGSVVYPKFNAPSLAFYALVILVASIVISAIPARRASRLSPIQALRQM